MIIPSHFMYPIYFSILLVTRICKIQREERCLSKIDYFTSFIITFRITTLFAFVLYQTIACSNGRTCPLLNSVQKFIEIQGFLLLTFFMCLQNQQETLRVVTIAMTCSTLASLWKFQYFRRPVYNPVGHLWWSFYCENSKQLSIFTKKHHHMIACLGSKYDTTFTWRLLKIFSLKDSWFLVLYFF